MASSSSFCPKYMPSLSTELQKPHSSLPQALPCHLSFRHRSSGSGSVRFFSLSSRCRTEGNRVRLSASASSATQVMDQSPTKTSSAVPTIVEVDLGDRSYPIYIGSGLLDQPDLLQRHIHGKRVLVVTNTKIAPLYLDKVVNALTIGNSKVTVESVILPDGE